MEMASGFDAGFLTKPFTIYIIPGQSTRVDFESLQYSIVAALSSALNVCAMGLNIRQAPTAANRAVNLLRTVRTYISEMIFPFSIAIEP